MVSLKAMPNDKTFVPLEDGFKQYGKDYEIISFRHAQPASVDTSARTVTIKEMAGAEGVQGNTPARTETLAYHALIIATGTNTPTPLTSMHGGHERTIEALQEMNIRLKNASSVIISGGGPVGVETAGEIGEIFNGTSVKGEPKVKITLIAGGKKLLPVLGQKHSEKAERFLKKVGVDVVYSAKVSKVDFEAAKKGKTTVHLDNGEITSADVYIPATGVTPNTDFLPQTLLNDRGYVKTNSSTLRVDDAGERVYAVGDVGSYTRGGVLDIMSAVPFLGVMISKDLGVPVAKASKRQFTPDTSETQIVPVGSKTGTGAFKGFGMPSFAIAMIKGKDYMIGNMKKTTHGMGYAKP